MVSTVLVSHGCAPAMADRVQVICQGVSYSAEAADPVRAAALAAAHPELAVVQDADRLDALGAVGLGRMFTYGGAHGGAGRTLADSMLHVDDKLLRLEGLAKTTPGRELARQRTERLRVFKAWWADEIAFASSSLQ